MADFLDVLRSGIALADQLTKENRLQPQVRHRSALDTGGGTGTVTLGEPVWRDALVEWKQIQVRTKEGESSASRAVVTFLDPAVVVTEEDEIILPDGSSGPIVGLEGPFDRETKQPMLTIVYMDAKQLA